MNAKQLSEKIHKMEEEYKANSENKHKDHYSRMFDAGVSKTCELINRDLLEAIDKGDIR